jgi:energy-coupling factor transport system ATP-binding protein
MIFLRDVTVLYTGRASRQNTALDQYSDVIESGEWVAVTGGNGSGKTTLLHAVAGLIEPAAGTIEYASGSRPRTALMLQDPDNQFVTTSGQSELALSPPPGGSAETAARRIAEAVERFELTDFVDRNPHRLSGGEKQRLALATVWLQDPEVLLLDEPSAYLDAATSDLCREFVAGLHRRGVTVLWATPGGEELAAADRVVCLDSGRRVFSGPADKLYDWSRDSGIELVKPPLWEVADALSVFVRPPAGAGDSKTGFVTSAGALAARVAEVAEVAARVDTPPGIAESVAPADAQPVVQLRSAEFGYGELSVLRDINTCVNPGDCVGISGNNGAGKSTLLGLLAGNLKPTGGKRDAAFERVSADGRQNVFYLFQFPEQLFFAETVAEELKFGLERLGLAPESRDRRSRDALARVGLGPDLFLGREPLTVSPGEMRRVAFAVAVSLEPTLLLLDEPNSCLDPAGTRALGEIVRDRKKNGATTVIASHDLSFLVEYCDRVDWLNDGAIECSLDTSQGVLTPGSVWPGPVTAVLKFQDELEKAGVNLSPRSLTPSGIAARLSLRKKTSC